MADELAASLDRRSTRCASTRRSKRPPALDRSRSGWTTRRRRFDRQRRGLGSPVLKRGWAGAGSDGRVRHGRWRARPVRPPCSAPERRRDSARSAASSARSRRPPPASRRIARARALADGAVRARVGRRPALLARFNPEASESLYKAWAQRPVGGRRRSSRHAMRVKAAPFGATAPPRSRSSTAAAASAPRSGRSRGAVVLGVRVGILERPDQDAALSAEFERRDVDRRAPTSDEHPASGPAPGHRPRSGRRATGSRGSSSWAQLPGARTIDHRDRRSASDVAVRLSDDGNRVWRPRRGEVLRHTQRRAPDHRRARGVRWRSTDASSVTVTDEVLLPPAPLNVLRARRPVRPDRARQLGRGRLRPVGPRARGPADHRRRDGRQDRVRLSRQGHAAHALGRLAAADRPAAVGRARRHRLRAERAASPWPASRSTTTSAATRSSWARSTRASRPGAGSSSRASAPTSRARPASRRAELAMIAGVVQGRTPTARRHRAHHASPGRPLGLHVPARDGEDLGQRRQGDPRRDARRGARQRRRRARRPGVRAAGQAAHLRRRAERAAAPRPTLEVRVDGVRGTRRSAGPARPRRPPLRHPHRRRRHDHGPDSATGNGARLPTGAENVRRPVPDRRRARAATWAPAASASCRPGRCRSAVSSTRCPRRAAPTATRSSRRAGTCRSASRRSTAWCRSPTTRTSPAPAPASARRAPAR